MAAFKYEFISFIQKLACKFISIDAYFFLQAKIKFTIETS